MSSIPDLAFSIALRVPYQSTSSLAQVSKLYASILRSTYYWQARADYMFLSTLADLYTSTNPKQAYLKLLTTYTIVLGSELFLSTDLCLYRSFDQPDMVDYFLNRQANPHYALAGAMIEGQFDRMRSLEPLPTPFSDSIPERYFEALKLISSRDYLTPTPLSYNPGHRQIVQYLRQLNSSISYFNEQLCYFIVLLGQTELIDLYFDLITQCSTSCISVVQAAIKSGSSTMIDRILAIPEVHLCRAYRVAAELGQVDRLVSFDGGTPSESDRLNTLYGLLSSDRLELLSDSRLKPWFDRLDGVMEPEVFRVVVSSVRSIEGLREVERFGEIDLDVVLTRAIAIQSVELLSYVVQSSIVMGEVSDCVPFDLIDPEFLDRLFDAVPSVKTDVALAAIRYDKFSVAWHLVSRGHFTYRQLFELGMRSDLNVTFNQTPILSISDTMYRFLLRQVRLETGDSYGVESVTVRLSFSI